MKLKRVYDAFRLLLDIRRSIVALKGFPDGSLLRFLWLLIWYSLNISNLARAVTALVSHIKKNYQTSKIRHYIYNLWQNNTCNSYDGWNVRKV